MDTQNSRMQLPYSAQFMSTVSKVRTRFQIYEQVLKANAKTPDVNFVGAYPCVNIGDIALGWTLREIARQLGVQSVLQRFEKSDLYPSPSRMVIGGGGVLPRNAPTVEKLLRTSPDLLAKSAVIGVGVGGGLGKKELSEELISFFQELPYFSVRSRYDQEQIHAATGLDNAVVHPDIAFALPGAFGLDLAQIDRREKVLGISALPFFMEERAGEFRSVSRSPHWASEEHFPELSGRRSELAQGYVNLIREMTEDYRSRGWQVRFVSFHWEDYLFAKSAFADLGADIVPYTRNPLEVLRLVATCERFAATRFHAHIFALLASTPLISLAYDKKCEALWSENDLSRDSQVNRIDFALNPAEATSQALQQTGVVLDSKQLAQIRAGAHEGILRGFKAIGLG